MGARMGEGARAGADAAGNNLHALIDAMKQARRAAVLSHLTRDKATFQAWEVNSALRYGDLADDEADKFRAEILGRQNVIGLSRDRRGGDHALHDP